MPRGRPGTDYGPAKFFLTKFLTLALLIVQSNLPVRGAFYEYFRFRRRSQRGDVTYYSCLTCRRYVTVRDGRIVGTKAPWDDHDPAVCSPLSEVEFEILMIQREMAQEARKGKSKPMAIHDGGAASLARKLADKDYLYDLALLKWPPFYKAKSVLARHCRHDRVSIPDPRFIPEEFLVTYRGRVMVNSRYYLEPWHLYSSQDGRMHIFADEWDLRAFHAAELVMADGTFKYCPSTETRDKFYQIYSIFCVLRGEGRHCGFVLLPGKNAELYIEMWAKLKEESERRFGPPAARKIVMIDFETGAIPALRNVFPNDIVKGCAFHFRQALFRNIQRFGLQGIYQHDSVPGVKRWLQVIMSMTQLPADMVRDAWFYCLKFHPYVADPVVTQALRNFSDYFQYTWITNPMYPPEMWTHFDNSGMKTTNVGEGFHSKFRHVFSTVHPPLPEFLKWLQVYHHNNQIRLQQLLDPNRIPDPKPQEEKYRKLHEDLENEKRRFWQEIHFRMAQNPVPAVWCDVVVGYLSRCAHLVGAN